MELNRYNNVGFAKEYLIELANEIIGDKCQLEIMLSKAKREQRNIIEKGRKQQERMHKLAMELSISDTKLHAKNSEIQDLIHRISIINDK